MIGRLDLVLGEVQNEVFASLTVGQRRTPLNLMQALVGQAVATLRDSRPLKVNLSFGPARVAGTDVAQSMRVSRATVSHVRSSDLTASRWAVMASMASAPRGSRSGVCSTSRAACIARAALAGSPGCAPSPVLTISRVVPTEPP